MPLVVVDDGKPLALAMLLGSLGNDGQVHLFKNNFTPAHDTVAADMTEADFDGYVVKHATSWLVEGSLDSDGRAVAQAVAVVWALSATPATTNQIYGYWIGDISDNLVWAERFVGAPLPMVNNGDFVAFKPQLTLKSEFSNI
jgi:hypothetical protein